MTPYQPKRTFDFFQLEDRILLSADGIDVDDGGSNPDAEYLDQVLQQLQQESAEQLTALEQAEADLLDREVDLDVDADVLDDPSSVDTARLEVVVVDSRVEDSESLLSDLRGQSDGSTQWVVIRLSESEDGIEQISSALDELSGVDAIHLLSHSDGEGIQLGDTRLDLGSALNYAGEIASWGHALATDADLLIYGCDLASTQDGQDLIEALAVLCDCDVAASDDKSGHEELDGDWLLEYTVGDVQAEVAFGYAAQASWYGTLDITTGLVAHYEFEDGSGSTIADSVGSNDGTLVGGAAFVAGQVGDGLDLNADTSGSSKAEIADDAVFDFGADDFGISFWYYADTSSTALVLSKEAGSVGFEFIQVGTTLAWSINGSSGSSNPALTGLTLDTWHHITASRSGNDFTLYTDGDSDTKTIVTGSVTNAAEIEIGALNTSTLDFDGRIDDLRFYDRALSSSDASELRSYTGPSEIDVDTTNDTVDGTTTDVATLLANKGADGFISLREAIIAVNNDASSGWTINLGAGTYDLSITGDGEDLAATGDLDILNTVSIVGAGTGSTIIDGTSMLDRLFDVRSGGDLSLDDLTLTGGDGDVYGGGAVYVASGGALTATDVVFDDNTVGNTNGGAIFSQGTTTLNRVAVTNSTSGGAGGGISATAGTLTIDNSTISGNTSLYDGAGIHVQNGSTTANIQHTTIANNNATSGNGGGLWVSASTVNTSYSIFAENSSAFGGNDVHGTIVSGGYNIIEHNSGFSGTVGTDILGSDPGLSALTLVDDTYVHAITNSSIAYNPAVDSGYYFDQRQTLRDDNPDIGAYEYNAPIIVDTTNDTVDGTTTDVATLLANKGADGFISLREAILAVNNDSGADWIINVGAGIFSIDDDGGGDNNGDFDIRNNVTIVGAGWESTFINGTNNDRVFQVHSGTVIFQDLTIQNGDDVGGAGMDIAAGTDVTLESVRMRNNDSGISNGGAILSDGTLAINNSVFDSNVSDLGGAFNLTATSDTTITNSLFVGNESDGHAGAINSQGILTITNSTFSGNTADNLDDGGAIRIVSGTTSLTNVTITGSSGYERGAVRVNNSATLNIQNTIIAGNNGDTHSDLSTAGSATVQRSWQQSDW